MLWPQLTVAPENKWQLPTEVGWNKLGKDRKWKSSRGMKESGMSVGTSFSDFYKHANVSKTKKINI